MQTYVKTRIPKELHDRLKLLQDQLHNELGLQVSFFNAGRAAAKALEKNDVKVIKVVSFPIGRKRRKNDNKLLFDI